jgi:hypothetical protein
MKYTDLENATPSDELDIYFISQIVKSMIITTCLAHSKINPLDLRTRIFDGNEENSV